MSSNDTPSDFTAAFEAEMGVTPPANDPTPPAPTPVDGEGEGGEQPSKASTEGEQPVSPPAGTPQPKVDEPAAPQDGEKPNGEGEEPSKPAEDGQKKETAEETANREGQEAAGTDEPKPLTSEDIKKAIAEANSESTQRIERVQHVRDEIISTVHPEGIDKNIYDSNGNVIKTAQDIVDRGLINEHTGEPYTYEQAAQFILEANRQMTENVEQLNSWAESVAEQNINLHEGNQRVMEKWGDILQAMPELAKDLAAKYITKQLEFDKTNSYITKMAMTPEEFYDTVMPPYRKLGEALANKRVEEENAAAQQQQQEQQQEQAERTGLPPQRGQSAVKANTGDPMLDALVDELAKG